MEFDCHRKDLKFRKEIVNGHQPARRSLPEEAPSNQELGHHQGRLLAHLQFGDSFKKKTRPDLLPQRTDFHLISEAILNFKKRSARLNQIK